MSTDNKLLVKYACSEHGLHDVGAIQTINTVRSEHATLQSLGRRVLAHEVATNTKRPSTNSIFPVTNIQSIVAMVSQN